jgi:phosphoribosyl-ATP pyrophosphohydrolase
MRGSRCQSGPARGWDGSTTEYLEKILLKNAKKLGMSAFTLHDLEKRVQDRAKESADVSYTRRLIDRGVAQCAKKLGEEAVEAAIAAIAEDRQRTIAEAADVLYHLLVVLHVRGITLDEVEAELGARTRQSGLDEKAARKGG